MTAPENGISLPGFEGFEGVEFLQKLPLFRSLSFEETRRLFAIATPRSVVSGDVVIEQNALGQALFIVKSGSLTVRRDGDLLGTAGPGELLGEMSLIDDVLTSSQVVAASDAALLVLERSDFDELLASDKDLALKVYKAFCRTLADRLRKANLHVPDDAKLASGLS